MNLFGIGLPEMGIIAVVALLIFGPDKLPEVMGQAGKMVRDFRGMTAGLTGEFEKTIAEAKELGNSFTKEIGGMTKEVNAVTNSVKKDLGVKTTPAPKKGMTSASAARKAGTAAAATGSATKASSASATPKPAAKASTTSATTTKAPAKSASTATTTSATTTTAPKIVAAAPKASRQDPVADISLFEPAPIERKPRARRATPTTFGQVDVFAASSDSHDAERTDALAHGDPIPVSAPEKDDALVRARLRRQSAGYTRQSA